jgi:hypothetical protein
VWLSVIIRDRSRRKVTRQMDKIKEFEEDFYVFDDIIENSDDAGIMIPSILNNFLEQGHYFSIPENICGLFLSTNPPRNCLKAMRLPFRCIYLDVKIPLKGGIINGLIIRQKIIEPTKDDDEYYKEAFYDTDIFGFKEHYNKDFSKLTKVEKKEVYEEIFEALETEYLFRFERDGKFECDTNKKIFFEGDLFFDTGDQLCQDELREWYHPKNEELWDIISKNDWILIENFIMNFCCFCNDPRVILVNRKMTEDMIKKRMKRNQTIVPNVITTFINDELKKYILEKNDFFKSIYDSKKKGVHHLNLYKYWVKGHYRKLRSERFKNKRGCVLWIAPFTRGEGLEITQLFSLIHKNESRKVNELNEGIKCGQ